MESQLTARNRKASSPSAKQTETLYCDEIKAMLFCSDLWERSNFHNTGTPNTLALPTHRNTITINEKLLHCFQTFHVPLTQCLSCSSHLEDLTLRLWLYQCV